MRAVIHIEVNCAENVMDVHIPRFEKLITNYLLREAYESSEFKVKAEKNHEPRTAAGSLD